MNTLKTLALGAATLFAATAMQAQEAKYVFYFIGDGMGMGHVNATETYNRDVLKSDQPILMLTFPVAGQVRTYSYNNPITDSAAAGTALSTGVKTRNGMIGEAPDSTDVQSIARDFLNHGFAVGVATSVAGDDATPACFYAHADSRKEKYKIAPQAATSGYDYIAGAMWRGMLDENGRENNWVSEMQSNGYTVSRGYQEWLSNARKNPKKSLLISDNPAGEHVGYTIDSIPGMLTLKQITEAGLQQLENSGKGKFFLMTEGGNIDWAAHANDAGAVIKEILNFQEAIDVAYQFYLQHPQETLIVITADHDTGGMALGVKGGKSGYSLWLADYQKVSKDRFSNYCYEILRDDKEITWEEMKEYIKENLGLFGVMKISEKEENALREDFEATFINKSGDTDHTLYADYNRFTTKVFELMSKKLNIGWTDTYHAGNFVPVFAIGAGSELFKGNINNIEIPMKILQAAGISR